MKLNKIKTIFLITISTFLILGCDMTKTIKVCSKVSSILELKYRDAVILLEDGKKVTVNQANLKLGDQYCYYEKQKE